MPESRTDQIIRETIDLVANQYGIDSKIVDAVIKSQFSFIKKVLKENKSIRIMNLGSFLIKPKYKRMLNNLGYIKRFKGTYDKYIKFIEENPGYFKRLEESRLERSRNRKNSKKEVVDMCEMPQS